MPSIDELAPLVLRRCYERVEAGEQAVSVQDAVAAMRLAWQIERDQAIPERDAALRQLEKWQQDMTEFTWALRVGLTGSTRALGQRSWPRSGSTALLRRGNW